MRLDGLPRLEIKLRSPDRASGLAYCSLTSHRAAGQRVLAGTRILRAGISSAGKFARARAFDVLHLSRAAADLVLVRGGLQRSILRRSGNLIVVENFVAAGQGLHKDAPAPQVA